MRRGDCIYQRKDGRWEARYIKGYDEVTGKAVYRAVYGASREEAETKRAQILDLYPTPSKDNIEDYHPELNLLILGAGSHGKNVYEIAEQLGVFGKIAFLDDHVTEVDGVPVLGKCKDAITFKREYPCAFVAIGDVTKRKKYVNLLLKQKFMLPRIVSPAASVSKYATIGEGSCILPLATVSSATVGKYCIVASRAIIEAEAVLGDFVHVDSAGIIPKKKSVPKETVVAMGEIYNKKQENEDEAE